jgi:hypothetical protein
VVTEEVARGHRPLFEWKAPPAHIPERSRVSGPMMSLAVTSSGR